MDFILCDTCGYISRSDSNYCERCGALLSRLNPSDLQPKINSISKSKSIQSTTIVNSEQPNSDTNLLSSNKKQSIPVFQEYQNFLPINATAQKNQSRINPKPNKKFFILALLPLTIFFVITNIAVKSWVGDELKEIFGNIDVAIMFGSIFYYPILLIIYLKRNKPKTRINKYQILYSLPFMMFVLGMTISLVGGQRSYLWGVGVAIAGWAIILSCCYYPIVSSKYRKYKQMIQSKSPENPELPYVYVQNKETDYKVQDKSYKVQKLFKIMGSWPIIIFFICFITAGLSGNDTPWSHMGFEIVEWIHEISIGYYLILLTAFILYKIKERKTEKI